MRVALCVGVWMIAGALGVAIAAQGERPRGTPGPRSLLIEDMTWTEVRDAIAAGKTTAIYFTGAIEQNGPGVALPQDIRASSWPGAGMM